MPVTPPPLDEVPALVSGWARRHSADLQDPEKAWGQCAIRTYALAEYLLERGVPAVHRVRITGRTYPGREHWAVLLADPDDLDAGAVVVDPSARQFRADAQYPWIGELNDWLDDASEWLVDGLDVEVYGPTGPADEVLASDWWVRDDIEPGPVEHAGLA